MLRASQQLRVQKVEEDDEEVVAEAEKREAARERAERARKSFAARKLSSSASLSSATPAKFRVASGRGDGGDRAFRTDDNKVSEVRTAGES